MVDLEKNGKGVSDEPTFVRISDKLGLRYQRSGSGPPLVLLHTIRTQLEYFRALAPLLAKRFTVYAVDLPGHGHSPIDKSAQYDEPYLRKGVVGFLKALDLRDVTLVGESVGAVLALTAAAEVPDCIRAVYALNPADYETRYGDSIRRGNWFANLIIGSLQVPVFGAIAASLANRRILGKIIAGGYADPRKLPADLLAEFHETGRRPNYHYAERKVLSWGKARELFSGLEGTCNPHLRRQGLVTHRRARTHKGRTEKCPPVHASEHRPLLVR